MKRNDQVRQSPKPAEHPVVGLKICTDEEDPTVGYDESSNTSDYPIHELLEEIYGELCNDDESNGRDNHDTGDSETSQLGF